MTRIFTLLSIVFFSFSIAAQEKFQVRDKASQESVPFVKVLPEGKQAIHADLDGYFTLDSTVRIFQLKFMGYRDTTIQVASIAPDKIIFMAADVFMFEEVKIVPGENPAHRIIDQVIANRKKNSPTENNAFRYDSYSKFYFTMDQKALDNIPENTKDSTLIRIRNFFDSQYLFLMESSSERQFMPPSRDKETIKAYKVSGFTDPMFSTFANEMQSFSFYENQFELLGKSYINPIALGGTRRYLFILEDTTIRGADTTYTISFRPRKGKNFDGLKGQLFINTNGFAIEKVISEPYQPGEGFTIKVVQEYEFIEGKKWFPVKLSSEMGMPAIKMNSTLENAAIVGKGNTYISNIVLDPELKKRDFSNISVETSLNAGSRSDKDWDSTRFYSLTEQERKTYRVIDSISKEYNFDQRLVLLSALSEGKIPLGRFNMDIRRLISYNLYENYRFGLGLETSQKIMKRATVGGYFGWATRDKEWKYGGFSDFKLYPKKEFRLRLVYQQDLLQRGGDEFRSLTPSFSSRDLYKFFYIKNMERQRLAEVLLSGFVVPSVKMALIGNYQRISFTEGYEFYPDPATRFDLAETALEVSWQPREKVMQLGNRRVSMGSKLPRLSLKITKGIQDVFESKYDYLRLHAELSQDVSIRGVGKFAWKVSGSATEGDVPLFLLHAGNATGGRWRLSVVNTFETMMPSTFFMDRQASLFTRFTFLGWKTKVKVFQPQLSIHHAIGYGTMKNRNYHSPVFQTMDKGYYEGGLILDKIYVSGFSAIGLGLFTNYGAYSQPRFEKNLMVKLSLSFNF